MKAWVAHSFPKLSDAVVALAGHRRTVAFAVALAAFWTLLGAALRFPTQWFLFSNMFGTLITLFILLLMQHSQNRDMRALQTKADELIRSSETAGNHLIAIERRGQSSKSGTFEA